MGFPDSSAKTAAGGWRRKPPGSAGQPTRRMLPQANISVNARHGSPSIVDSKRSRCRAAGLPSADVEPPIQEVAP